MVKKSPRIDLIVPHPIRSDCALITDFPHGKREHGFDLQTKEFICKLRSFVTSSHTTLCMENSNGIQDLPLLRPSLSTTPMRQLLADENFTNLIRAEGLDTLPKYIAERVWPGGYAA